MAVFTPRRIGILHHPKLPRSQPLADEIAAFVAARGGEAWTGSSWEPQAIRGRIEDADVLVTLGGDGTILRAARLGAPLGVSVLGVNLGRLGFLAEVQPEDWQEGIGALLRGEAWLEQRMMLDSEHWNDGDRRGCYLSLNEVVVGRGRIARVIRISALADGAELANYVADGLIAATPTGSTAYAYAAGGPIMPPELRNILLVPIAPTVGLTRPVVLSEGAAVSLTVETDHEAILTVDGQTEVSLASGDEVRIRASEHVATFARLRPRSYFYDSLSQRLRCR